MIDFKCKMCGGSLTVSEGQTVVKCDFCDTNQTVPVFDDEKKLAFYNRANILRLNCEFDKAAGIYETIVTEYTQEAEAYWGLVLCKYGIEYVDDPKTGAKVPTCHRTLFTPIFKDSDYKNAIKYSDVVSRDLYEEEAKVIAKIQASILEISSKEEPFDVFICYKETDAVGNRTEDSVLAFDIYKKLTKEGYKVFYSKVTLEDKLGSEYEPYIFAALYSAKVMLVVTTSKENCESVWVANEWKRYLSLIDNGLEKYIISCVKGISPKELPLELQNIQGIDMSKIGAMQDLLYGIEKLHRYSSTQKVTEHPLYEDDDVVEEEDKIDEAYLIEAGYNKYVSDLRDLDSFIASVSDVEPIITFFETAGDYKDSKHYLDIAKIEYAKRAASYKETIQALVYLDEIPHVVGVEQLREECKIKLIKYRKKDLQNRGLAVPEGDEETTYCLCSVMEGLAESKKRQNNYSSELDEFDWLIIKSCEESGAAYINEVGLKIIEREHDKAELLKIQKILINLADSNITNYQKIKEFVDNSIQAIYDAEQAEIEKQKKQKKKYLISTIALILSIVVILSTVLIVINHGYSAEHFTIEVVSKKNDSFNDNLATGYWQAGYFYTFGFEVTNDSPNAIKKLSGTMDINNSKGKTLATTTINLSGDLESGEKGTWNVQVNVDKGDNAKEIWNSDFSELEITFRIREITFENGTEKRYNDTKNEIVHKSSGEKTPDADNPSGSQSGNNTLLSLVKNYAGEDAILPDNYSSADYHVPDCQRYSYKDDAYYDSYYALIKVEEENKDGFLNDFIEKLISNGFALRYDEFDYEYIKNDTVIYFTDVIASRLYNPSTGAEEIEYYYINYYAYSLN